MVWQLVQRKKLELSVLVLALLARLAVFYLASTGFFLVGEGVVQANLAENILSGKGFMLSESMFHDSNPKRDEHLEFFRETGGYYGALLPEQPTTFLVPGYALFMACVFFVSSPGNLLAVIALQLFLGVFTVFLGFRLAARFLSGRWLAAAGIIMALDPFELYYQAIPVTQALFSLLFIAGLLVSIRFMEKPSPQRGLSAGFLWAVTFMVRPAALPMVLWLAFVVAVSKKCSLRTVASLFILIISFALPLAPWVIRNKNTMGRYQLLPLQGGVQMWEFNGRIFTDAFLNEQEGATTLYAPVRSLWISRLNLAGLAEFPEFSTESEFERDSILVQRQTAFIKANPGVYLHLVACRFTEFFKPFPLNQFSPAHTLLGLLSFFWVGVFFFAGVILLLYRGWPGVFLAGIISGYVLMHLLTASGTPHRVALDIPLFIASLIALKFSYERLKAVKSSA